MRASPLGKTSTSLAVKSVSGWLVDAYRTTRTGPVTSRSRLSGALVYTSTSLRVSTPRWSRGPQGNAFGLQHTAPPSVGAGLFGSYTYSSGLSFWPLFHSKSPPLSDPFACPFPARNNGV